MQPHWTCCIQVIRKEELWYFTDRISLWIREWVRWGNTETCLRIWEGSNSSSLNYCKRACERVYIYTVYNIYIHSRAPKPTHRRVGDKDRALSNKRAFRQVIVSPLLWFAVYFKAFQARWHLIVMIKGEAKPLLCLTPILSHIPSSFPQKRRKNKKKEEEVVSES